MLHTKTDRQNIRTEAATSNSRLPHGQSTATQERGRTSGGPCGRWQGGEWHAQATQQSDTSATTTGVATAKVVDKRKAQNNKKTFDSCGGGFWREMDLTAT